MNLFKSYIHSIKNFNFVIIGFPSNDFLWQEPGSNDQIADFCEENYGVTFPMMSKITVKGSKKHPIYQFLTQKSKNNYKDSKVTWNFQKYLINKDGKVEKIIAPRLDQILKKLYLGLLMGTKKSFQLDVFTRVR